MQTLLCIIRYGISATESQTFLPMKCPQWRKQGEKDVFAGLAVNNLIHQRWAADSPASFKAMPSEIVHSRLLKISTQPQTFIMYTCFHSIHKQFVRNINEIAECKIKCMGLSKNLTVIYSETCGPQGCCLMGARSPEAPTICSQVTKLMILRAIASVPTSNEGTTEFPAHFALLKQKRETCVRRPRAKHFR